jgi:hypothetical protein
MATELGREASKNRTRPVVLKYFFGQAWASSAMKLS